MKKINIAGIIWKSSIFLILIVILFAVVDYKVNFEYLSNNSLYFYDSAGTLSVTEVKNDKNLLYSKYECGYDDCPVLKSELDDTFVILSDKLSNILFDYRKGQTISSDYDDYQILNNNYIIVTKYASQGIIDTSNQLLVPLQYDKIGVEKDNYLTGYTLTSIVAKKENKYGIISVKDGKIIAEFNYDETELDKLFQILKDETGLNSSN